MVVYVVQHVRVDGDDEDIKLIGVFSSETIARSTVDALASQPGFRDYPDGFHISPYEVDKVHWTDGFVRVEH